MPIFRRQGRGIFAWNGPEHIKMAAAVNDVFVVVFKIYAIRS
jgi:hypothetical protein